MAKQAGLASVVINGLVERLGLEPHPEGGFYRRTYAAGLVIPREHLSSAHGGDRPVSTAIHFLVTNDSVSRLHRIASDEMWHFYDGDPLCIVEFWRSAADDGETSWSASVLGRPTDGFACTHVVKAGRWFGCCPLGVYRKSLRPAHSANVTAAPKVAKGAQVGEPCDPCLAPPPVAARSHGFCLVGCTVSPGFHFDDFKMADREQMLEMFAQAARDGEAGLDSNSEGAHLDVPAGGRAGASTDVVLQPNPPTLGTDIPYISAKAVPAASHDDEKTVVSSRGEEHHPDPDLDLDHINRIIELLT